MGNSSRIGASIYPYTEWSILEDRFQEDVHRRNESVLAIGNGYIGMRGNFEEGFQGPKDKSVNGTYLNGFYDSERIQYPEGAYGYAEYSQTMLNVTDSKIIMLEVDGERFSLYAGKVVSHKRELHMQSGMLRREAEWESSTGKRVRIVSRRMICLQRKHLAVTSYEVTPLNFDGVVTLCSAMNGQVTNMEASDDPRVGAGAGEQILQTEEVGFDASRGWIRQRTKHTGFLLLAGMDHAVHAPAGYTEAAEESAQYLEFAFRIPVKQGEEVSLTKYMTYHTSKDYPEQELKERMDAELAAAKEAGFAQLAEEQAAFLTGFWRGADIRIEGDPALQQGIRFNAFQLLQSVGRDGKTNISAKGLTGEGYEGHYFWDTETYILPFFIYTNPAIGRSLLEYRYSTLDAARERAGQMSQKGALYPWRTINGAETSAYFPAGTAQMHINADIIYGLKKYVQASGDDEFLLRSGAEMAFETARFFADVGYFNPRRDGQFCIDAVTGPDEYTAIVNNNAFTNLMAKDTLLFACATAEWMKANKPDVYDRLRAAIGLGDEELARWKEAAEKMFVPFDAELGITAQDDTFLNKKKWDFAGTPKANYPLLLHYHPLVIYRHQVLKQADVVLALYMQSQRFSLADKIRNYAYYEPLTTHDSSLSPSIHSIIAAEIGKTDQAYDYFRHTARMDLDDMNGNVKDGLHTAAMAGAWLSIVGGFAGMRDIDGKLRFNPYLPKQWEGFSFRITYQGRLIEIGVKPDRVVYKLLEGSDISIMHRSQSVKLTPGTSEEISLKPVLEGVIIGFDGMNLDEKLPRMTKLLAELKQQGLKLAIASANENTPAVLERLNLASLFDAVVDSKAAKVGKPDPEPFLLAAEALGVYPTHCIGVDDAPGGIAAIKAARMTAVGIGSGDTLSQADAVLPDIERLSPEVLADVFGPFIHQ